MKLAISSEKDLIELVMLLTSCRPETNILIIVSEHFLANKIASQFGKSRSLTGGEVEYLTYRECNLVVVWSRCKFIWKYCKPANIVIELDYNLEKKHIQRSISNVENGCIKEV